jgi:hypothetical protein
MVMILFCSLGMTAQKTYTVSDFFYNTVPPASTNAQVEVFTGVLDGESKKYGVNNYPTLGSLNNRVASLIVPEGLQVTFWFDKGYRGHKTTFLPGAYLSAWDSAYQWESMKIERLNSLDGAYFLQMDDKPTTPEWRGRILQGLGPGKHDYLKNELICNDCWNFLWVVGNVQVIVYDHAGFNAEGPNNSNIPFTDDSPNKTGTMYDLTDYGFYRNVSSIDVSLLSYGLHRVDRRKIGAPTPLPQERIELGFEKCNNNPGGDPMSVDTNFQVGLTQTITSSFARGTSVNFGITRTATVTAGIPGLGEASLSTEFSLNIEGSLNWETTNERAIETTVGVTANNQVIPHGKRLTLEAYTRPERQLYKETYYFRPIKAEPNSEGVYEFIENAHLKEKKVELDVYETSRTTATSNGIYTNCSDSSPLDDTTADTASTSDDTGSSSGTGTTDTSTTTTDTSTPINGRNVRVVTHTKGQFVQINATTWHEKGTNGQTSFTYVELGRDDWSVFLHDKKRDVRITLNLWKKEITYKPASATNFRKIFTITNSQ